MPFCYQFVTRFGKYTDFYIKNQYFTTKCKFATSIFKSP